MSMTPYTLDQLRELAPAYVLGALDAEERAAFEVGLRTPEFTAPLQQELQAWQATTDAMVKAQAVAPPSDLKARFLSRIASDNAAATAGPAVIRATPTSKAVRVTPPQPMVVDQLALRQAAKASRAGWWTSGVLTMGLAATALFALSLREQLTGLEEQLKEKSALLVSSTAKLSESQKTLETLLSGRGNVVLVNLDATIPAGPGMQVFWNVREGKAIVNAYGLAQVTSDRAYMLWMIRDGKPVALKLFTPDAGGRALVADVTIPTSTTGITLLAVTEESAQGAEAPTMTPFIAGAVPTK